MRGDRLAKSALVVIAVATAVAVVVLWPGERPEVLGEGITAPTERAEVTSVTEEACPAPQPGTCTTAEARLETGSDEGEAVTLPIASGGLAPELEVGAEIRVSRAVAPPTQPGAEVGLIAAVPITTAIASALALGSSVDRLPPEPVHAH
jgi:hypothetical protein